MQKQTRVLGVLGCIAIVGLLSFVSTQAKAADKKDWTMLVYLNGNNNLDDFGAKNIEQMQQVGSTNQLNVVVQWASLAASDTKRLLVQKDPTATTVTSPVVQTLPVVDMGDKQSLTDFIQWGVQTYPADHYFVVVWDHGAGWHLTTKMKMHSRDISFDERSGHHITTEELGTVIDGAAQLIGHKVDIYGSDACLMAMVEVAQQMYGSVGTFVGSEEVEPGDGWPYDSFLKAWAANPSASANDIGKMLVTAYHDYYTAQQNSSTTFSAIDMDRLPDLLTSITSLKEKLLAKTDLTAVKTAAASSSRYTYNDYVDLSDLVDNVRTALDKSDEAQVALDNVSLQIKSAIVASATTGIKANGISIWWPSQASDFQSYGDRYSALKFNRATGWADFLKRLF